MALVLSQLHFHTGGRRVPVRVSGWYLFVTAIVIGRTNSADEQFMCAQLHRLLSDRALRSTASKFMHYSATACAALCEAEPCTPRALLDLRGWTRLVEAVLHTEMASVRTSCPYLANRPF